MPRHYLDDQAEADLRSIWDFIDSRDGPGRADNVTDRIVNVFSLLAELPFMGVARTEFNRPNLRSFVVRNTSYIIFYYPADDGVRIVYIRHGSRDLTTLFDQ